jgi:hypothetical protein
MTITDILYLDFARAFERLGGIFNIVKLFLRI